jgi:hypothetical protein
MKITKAHLKQLIKEELINELEYMGGEVEAGSPIEKAAKDAFAKEVLFHAGGMQPLHGVAFYEDPSEVETAAFIGTIRRLGHELSEKEIQELADLLGDKLPRKARISLGLVKDTADLGPTSPAATGG